MELTAAAETGLGTMAAAEGAVARPLELQVGCSVAAESAEMMVAAAMEAQ